MGEHSPHPAWRPAAASRNTGGWGSTRPDPRCPSSVSPQIHAPQSLRLRWTPPEPQAESSQEAGSGRWNELRMARRCPEPVTLQEETGERPGPGQRRQWQPGARSPGSWRGVSWGRALSGDGTGEGTSGAALGLCRRGWGPAGGSASTRPHQAQMSQARPFGPTACRAPEQKVLEAVLLGGKVHHWVWCVHMCTVSICVHVYVRACVCISGRARAWCVPVCIYVGTCVHACVRVCAALAHSQAQAPAGRRSQETAESAQSALGRAPGLWDRGCHSVTGPRFPQPRPWCLKHCPAGQPPRGSQRPLSSDTPASAPEAPPSSRQSPRSRPRPRPERPFPGSRQAGLACE